MIGDEDSQMFMANNASEWDWDIKEVRLTIQWTGMIVICCRSCFNRREMTNVVHSPRYADPSKPRTFATKVCSPS
jgi:hypothetical protein